MRLLKFRAWVDFGKEYKIKPHMALVTNMYEDGDITTDQEYWIGGVLMEIVKDYQYTIMQYTGLKDKNGKEIYEGDIVKYIDTHNLFETGNYLIGFRDGAFTLENQHCDPEIIDISSALSERQNPGYAPKNYRVIGNKYENPKLLIDY